MNNTYLLTLDRAPVRFKILNRINKRHDPKDKNQEN